MDQAHIDHDGRVSSPQVDDPQQQQILGSDGAPSRKKGRAYAQQAYDLGRGGNTAPNGQHAGQMNQTPVQFSGYPSANPYEAGANPTQGGPGLAPHYGYGQSQPQQSDHRQPEQGYQPPSSQNYGVDQGYDQLNDRFEQMGIAGGQQQPQPQYQAGQHVPMNRLQPSDLVNQPFNVAELDQPPPPIVLPPNSSVTPSPEANAPPKYIRCTLNAVPTTHSLLNKSRLPFALIINPYTSLHDSEDPVPLVSDQIISRCRRCRSYINPYAIFLDHGRRWRCNMCNLTNDVPQAFDYDQESKQNVNRYHRSELNYSVVEFIAPQEYMIRPPQPLTYLFLLDVSINSIASGLLATAARTILDSLTRIPNADRRTRIGFIAVDTGLHYFQIPRDGIEGTETTMLVVSDIIGEPYTPVPGELLVTLADHRHGVERFLEKLPEMFQNSSSTGSCMGSALKAAKNLISAIGGKVVVLTGTLPNVGDGELKMREDKKLLGTSKEGSLLQTANNFYKSFAVDCSKVQVSVDMFLFASTYQDVASLSCLPRYTGGQTYFYPGWNAARSEDALKFMKEFSDFLSAEIGLEAVMRVRATTGLRMSGFYGNFFNRSSDLCAFPAFPRDQGYVVEVAIDETLNKGYICMQTAVLHTTCNGERRIRVLTLSLPTTQVLSEVYASADQIAITTYYSHKAVERALSGNLEGAREILESKIIELLRVYRKEMTGGSVGGGGVQFPSNLRALPVLFLALLKNVGLRKSSLIPSDLRSAALCLLSTLPSPALLQFIYPKLYNLHEMPDEAGLPDSTTGEIVLPPAINLSSQNFAPYGLYLLTDGQTQFLWIGAQAVQQLVQDVFGMQDISQVRVGKQEMPVVDSDFNERVRAVIEKSRDPRSLNVGSITSPSLYVVREDGEPSLRLWAQTLLVEDRADQGMSLQQWMGNLREKVIQ